MRTTKGGPHGHVHRARNFISESGRPCVFHAARKRQDAIPIDNHAIYMHATHHAMPMDEKKKRTFHQKIDAMNEKDGVAMPREKRTAAVLYLV